MPEEEKVNVEFWQDNIVKGVATGMIDLDSAEKMRFLLNRIDFLQKEQVESKDKLEKVKEIISDEADFDEYMFEEPEKVLTQTAF